MDRLGRATPGSGMKPETWDEPWNIKANWKKTKTKKTPEHSEESSDKYKVRIASS